MRYYTIEKKPRLTEDEALRKSLEVYERTDEMSFRIFLAKAAPKTIEKVPTKAEIDAVIKELTNPRPGIPEMTAQAEAALPLRKAATKEAKLNDSPWGKAIEEFFYPKNLIGLLLLSLFLVAAFLLQREAFESLAIPYPAFFAFLLEAAVVLVGIRKSTDRAMAVFQRFLISFLILISLGSQGIAIYSKRDSGAKVESSQSTLLQAIEEERKAALAEKAMAIKTKAYGQINAATDTLDKLAARKEKAEAQARLVEIPNDPAAVWVFALRACILLTLVFLTHSYREGFSEL